MDSSVALRVWITDAASKDETRDQPKSDMTTESSRNLGLTNPDRYKTLEGADAMLGCKRSWGGRSQRWLRREDEGRRKEWVMMHRRNDYDWFSEFIWVWTEFQKEVRMDLCTFLSSEHFEHFIKMGIRILRSIKLYSNAKMTSSLNKAYVI